MSQRTRAIPDRQPPLRRQFYDRSADTPLKPCRQLKQIQAVVTAMRSSVLDRNGKDKCYSYQVPQIRRDHE